MGGGGHAQFKKTANSVSFSVFLQGNGKFSQTLIKQYSAFCENIILIFPAMTLTIGVTEIGADTQPPYTDLFSVCIVQSGLWFRSRVHTKKIIFLFLSQNICCGYSKELSL